jgi:electron transport complex protein RnfG
MLRSLGSISAVSGLLVVLAYQITAPIIAENQRLRTERAVFQAIPGAVTKRDFVVTADGAVAPAGPGVSGEPIYPAYDAQDKLLGVGIIGVASGYGGPLKVLFDYDPAKQAIVGSKVLQSTETPGFGDKVDSDPDFLKNVQDLDARLAPDGKALANPIVTVKNGTKKHPWEVDAISGATISSKAFGLAADRAAGLAAPAIQRDLAKLTGQN